MYCGNGCNQHALGSGGCGDSVVPGNGLDGKPLNKSNKLDDGSVRAWTEFCHEADTQLWFWYYSVNFVYTLVESPINLSMYYDFSYILNECGADGIYYEGGSSIENNGFASMRCYMAIRLMHDPAMTLQQYLDGCKEYLRMYFGPGYAEIYKYMLLLEEAGDRSGSCFLNNCSAPGEMYSYEFLADNYEIMRSYVTDAYSVAESEIQKERLNQLLISCDFMGLSVCHDRMYTNGLSQTRSLYAERYENLFRLISEGAENGTQPPLQNDFSEPLSFEYNPFEQFYGGNGSVRDSVTFDV